MFRFSRILLLVFLLDSAYAAKRISVQEIQNLIESEVKAGRSDEEIAKKLFKVEINERLTENRVAIFPSTLGKKTRETLQLIAHASALLDPPAAEISRDAAPGAPSQAGILAKARVYASEYIRRLPNFICTMNTRQLDDNASVRGPAIWNYFRVANAISGELSIHGGKEAFVQNTAARRAENTLTTSGEFGSIIEALFLPDSGIAIEWTRWETLRGRRVAVFRYSIDDAHSRFSISRSLSWSCTAGKLWAVKVAYHGELSIEPASGAILRVTRAAEFAGDDPVRRMETVVSFDEVGIAGTKYTLPTGSTTFSEVRMCIGAAGGRTGALITVNRKLLNETGFTAYRRFGSESRLMADDTPPPVPAPPIPPSAQPAAEEKEDPAQVTFRTSARMVEIGVVVRDKSGKAVTDLKQEDFEVYDEGKRQEIRWFKAAGAAPAPTRVMKAQAAGPGAPRTFSNRTEVSPSTAVTVILIDQVNTAWMDQAWGKRAIIRFLRQLRGEDHVGIYIIGRDGFRVLHEFIHDSNALVKLLESWDGRVKVSGAQTGLEPRLIEWLNSEDPGYRASQLDPSRDSSGGYDAGSMTALMAVARHLAGVPGRKNVIFVSAGFKQAEGGWDGTVVVLEALANANVALYPVDPRGLMSLYADATYLPPLVLDGNGIRHELTPSEARRIAAPDTKTWNATQDTLKLLADRTGGRAFMNNNDTLSAIRSAFEDLQATYGLGFYPSEPRLDDKFHSLVVKAANRSGLTVLHRKGYVDSGGRSDWTQERRDALWSPVDATAVTVSASAVATADGYEVTVAIGPEGLDLRRENDRITGKVNVLIAARDSRGEQMDYVEELLGMDLGQGTYGTMLRDGFAYRKTFAPKQRAASLRVVVRDVQSGNVGSVTVPLEVEAVAGVGH